VEVRKLADIGEETEEVVEDGLLVESCAAGVERHLHRSHRHKSEQDGNCGEVGGDCRSHNQALSSVDSLSSTWMDRHHRHIEMVEQNSS